jgi:hypothetical protein
MIELYSTMPDGWDYDKSWGSYLTGYLPIHTPGKSILNGGKKGLLKIDYSKIKHNKRETIFILK